MKESRGASRQSADDGDTATTTIVTISNFIYRFRFLACSICLSLSLSLSLSSYIYLYRLLWKNKTKWRLHPASFVFSSRSPPTRCCRIISSKCICSV